MNVQEQERRLVSVLDRQTACDTLSALMFAIKPAAMRPNDPILPLEESAICLDSSVFLRLAGHDKSADIIDYLTLRHSAPLVLPGQAIQEFWNNQLQVVDTVAASLRKQLASFKTALIKADENFSDFVSKIENVLDDLNSEHGHVYDDTIVRKTLTLLEALANRATVPYASRERYAHIADLRKRTKTPPGFRDDGDGDFFIWVDLLTGLQHAQAIGTNFSRVILVSLDKKLDWSRSGVAHPILAAEVMSLLGVPFEIWTTDKLASEIAHAT